MNSALLKLAPMAVVIASGGFVAWPYAGPDAPHWESAAVAATTPRPAPAAKPAAGGTAGKGSSKELTAELLEPPLPPTVPRDPFCDPEAARAEARAKIAEAIARLWAERVAPPARPTRTAARPPRNVLRTAAKAGAGAGKAAPDEAPPPPPVDPLAGLTLNATYLMGGKGMAVINDATYSTGQVVPTEDATPGAPRLILAEVRKHSVVLWHGAKRLELKFAELKSNPGAAAPTPAGKPSPKSGGGKPGGKSKGGVKKGYDPFDV